MSRQATMTNQTSARKQAVKRLMNQTPTEKRADTQRRLLEAGSVVIAEHGIGRASIGLICEKAGFTRGAFYSNFTDLDHFVEQVARREWDATIAVFQHSLDTIMEKDAPAAPEGDIHARGAALAQAMLRAVPRDRQFRLLWSELGDFSIRNPEESVRLRETILGLRHEISGFVQDVLHRYGLRPIVAEDDIVDMLLGLNARSTRNRLLGDHATDGTELIDRLLPLIMPALAELDD